MKNGVTSLLTLSLEPESRIVDTLNAGPAFTSSKFRKMTGNALESHHVSVQVDPNDQYAWLLDPRDGKRSEKRSHDAKTQSEVCYGY